MKQAERAAVQKRVSSLVKGPTMFMGAVASHFRLQPGEAVIAAIANLVIQANLAEVDEKSVTKVLHTFFKLADEGMRDTQRENIAKARKRFPGMGEWFPVGEISDLRPWEED